MDSPVIVNRIVFPFFLFEIQLLSSNRTVNFDTRNVMAVLSALFAAWSGPTEETGEITTDRSVLLHAPAREKAGHHFAGVTLFPQSCSMINKNVRDITQLLH